MNRQERNLIELISVVNENYKHVNQLEQLIKLLELKDNLYELRGVKEWEDELSPSPNKRDSLVTYIAKTTHNSHYDYNLYTLDYKNPEYHVFNFTI